MTKKNKIATYRDLSYWLLEIKQSEVKRKTERKEKEREIDRWIER
jgi:hypothetical protein